MNSLVYINLILSGFFYFIASTLYLLSFFRSGPELESKGYLCIRIGFLGASIFLGLEALVHGFSFPILNFSHVIAFFSWALAFLYLVALVHIPAKSFGLILAPVLFILTLIAVLQAGANTYRNAATIGGTIAAQVVDSELLATLLVLNAKISVTFNKIKRGFNDFCKGSV